MLYWQVQGCHTTISILVYVEWHIPILDKDKTKYKEAIQLSVPKKYSRDFSTALYRPYHLSSNKCYFCGCDYHSRSNYPAKDETCIWNALNKGILRRSLAIRKKFKEKYLYCLTSQMKKGTSLTGPGDIYGTFMYGNCCLQYIFLD